MTHLSQKHISFVYSLFGLARNIVFACIVFLSSAYCHAQRTQSLSTDSIADIRDSIAPVPITELNATTIQKRKRIATATQVAVYGTAMLGLYTTWYKDHPQSGFHFYNDSKEWKGMDKFGHAYSAYALSKASMELWRWTGMKHKKAVWLGGLSGAVFQTVIETLDGFSADWGWSWADIAANSVGSGLLISQELLWESQRIQLKTSFHKKHYAEPMLNNRSDVLFGKTFPERFLKDYNGQTYWLSANLHSFFPTSNIPKWLQLSVGTGAEGMFGGYENIARDEFDQVIFDRTDIPRRRQWYLAPDVDLTKIHTNSKTVKIILYLLNMFKIPTPSLELSGGKLSFIWLSF